MCNIDDNPPCIQHFRVLEKQRQDFHNWVAKLLYLARRARPGVLTAVAYLAIKVQKCDRNDLDKLDRVMRYLRGTRDRGVVLRPGVGDEVIVYRRGIRCSQQWKISYG